jgi:hypothetical protein
MAKSRKRNSKKRTRNRTTKATNNSLGPINSEPVTSFEQYIERRDSLRDSIDNIFFQEFDLLFN